MLTFDDDTFESINFSQLPQSLRVNVEGIVNKHRSKKLNVLSNDEQLRFVFDVAVSLKIHDLGPIGVRLICCQTFKDWLSTFNKHKQILGLPKNFIQLKQNQCYLATDIIQSDNNQAQAIFNFGLFLRLIKYSFGNKLPAICFQIPIDFGPTILERFSSFGFKEKSLDWLFFE